MKKYLITGALTIIAGGFLTSCHETEIGSDTYIEQKLQTYEQVFKQEFGEIDPYQDWGFGSASVAARTRAASMTRAAVTITSHEESAPNAPTQPTFKAKGTITRPTMPTSYHNTSAEVIAAKLPYAKDVTSDGTTSYVNSSNSGITDKKNQIIYVIGDVTLEYSPGTGSVFVVTQNSRLTISGFSQYVSVYLASDATLDVSGAQSGVTFDGDGSGLYMNSGSSVIASTISFYNSSEVLNAGGTITATNLYVNKNTTLWNEGRITVSNELEGVNEKAYIYNAAGKTITTKDLKLINNDNFLYNDGTINASGEILMTNNSAELINNGTLKGASLDLSAGGNMYTTTDGTTTIYGLTYINNNNENGTSWRNDGVYWSGDFTVMNMDKVYNNCKLTITGDSSQGFTGSGLFTIDHNGSFVLNGDASVKADNMVWGTDAEFYMNTNSMLWVDGQILTRKTNKGYGAHGLGSGYSIIKAGSIAYETVAMCRMNYYGNIYVDTDTHFDQGFVDGNHDQPYYYYNTDNKTVMFKFLGDANPITTPIEAGKCHHGYGTTTVDPDNDEITIITPTDGDKTKTVIEYFNKIERIDAGRVFCEDLGVVTASDIDFNDIVFDAYIYSSTPIKRTTITINNGTPQVTEENDGSTSYFAEVYLLAAGGTLEVSLAGWNVKDLFGVGKTTMVNTINETPNADGTVSTYGNNYAIGGKSVVPMGKIDGISKISDIKIIVRYNALKTELELTAYSGAAPHKICVPIGTRWPYERIEINKAYTNFNKYVKGEGRLGTVSGPVGTGTDYESNERGNTTYWNSGVVESNLYKELPYTAPASGTFYEENGKIGSTITTGGKDGDYNGEPILVRRRN